ncbi:MAG: FAD-dependent oxidoreductase [Rhodospirillaceae bacterium]
MSQQFKIKPISKRHLLLGATAGLAASVLPAWRRAEAADHYGLIVIGGGTAGMPAAIFAAARGARVLVIDKAPILGGTLDRSNGQIAAAGTVFQEAKGIQDSPDEHYADNMRINRNTADPVLTRLFVDNAGESVNWLAKNGYRVMEDHPTTGGGHEPFSKARYMWGAEEGVSIFNAMKPALLKGVESGRIDLRMSTGAVDLIQDAMGAVLGVVTEDETGKLQDHYGQHVLISSGGFAANPRMFQDMHGVPLTRDIAYPYSQGQGILLGQSAGGYVRGQDKFASIFGGLMADNIYPTQFEAYFSGNPARRPPREIYVNVHGDRFVREDYPGLDYREQALGKQPGLRMWVIADHEMMTTSTPFVGRWTLDQMMEGFDTHPMFFKADSIDALGVKAGVNPQGLRKSVDQFNAAIENGAPDPFGRVHRPSKISKGPFYAVIMTGWTVVSSAGLTVDGRLRVMRPDGTPVPNLYAAGEVLGAGVTSGQAFTNGSLVTPAITFGRLLGQKFLNFEV